MAPEEFGGALGPMDATQIFERVLAEEDYFRQLAESSSEGRTTGNHKRRMGAILPL